MPSIFSTVSKYARTMAPSFLVLFFIAYGMATQNSWFQFGGVFIVLALQLGYQLFKSARASPIISANIQEAARAKRVKPLLTVSEQEVSTVSAADKGSGESLQAGKMMLLLFVPAAILFGTTFLIGTLFPGVPYWQSFVVGFLVSMPVSAALTSRTGISQGGPMVTPTSYIVTEKGIAFDQMKRSFILRFPLKKVSLGKGGNAVEVEGFTEAPLIPNRLKLYTQKADELLKILGSHIKSST